MSAPPVVIGHWAQAKANTLAAREAEHERRELVLDEAAHEAKERALPSRSARTVQEIGFFAEHYGKPIGPITVLAGEGAPTVTGGFAQIAKIKRFQRLSVTVAEGYEPLTLSVPILFDAVALTKNRPDIEAQIVTLEGMAGRPKGAPLPGEPPNVEIFAADSQGIRTNLVPRKFQEDSELLWYITNITWDPNPLRDRGGERLRQAATVELTEIILAPTARESAIEFQQSIAAHRPKKFITTSTIDTIRRVAVALGARFHDKRLGERYQPLLTANPKLPRNANRNLKPGTKVKIPPDFWNKVPQ